MADKKFRCACCNENMIDPRVEAMHASIEADVGDKVIIISGYRCAKHNQTVGGSPTSSHLKGLAWDVATPDSRTRYRIINSAIRLGIHRIGIGTNFIHLDIDRQKEPRVIWLYA